MEIEQYVEILRRDDHFTALGQEECEDLVELSEARTLVSGEPLWSVGEVGDGAYLLVSGRVELTWRAQPDGKQQRQIGDSGTLFGLAHLAGEWEHESTAYPIERTEVLGISREKFQNLFDAQHPAAFRLLDAVAEHLVDEMRDANRRLREVFGHPAETLRMLRRRSGESGRR